MRVSELSLAGCGLTEFNARMVKGLESSLAVLDLSNNNLRRLDPNLLRSFSVLQELKTLGNTLETFLMPPELNGNVLSLEIGGNDRMDHQLLLKDIRRFVSSRQIMNFKSYIGGGGNGC